MTFLSALKEAFCSFLNLGVEDNNVPGPVNLKRSADHLECECSSPSKRICMDCCRQGILIDEQTHSTRYRRFSCNVRQMGDMETTSFPGRNISLVGGTGLCQCRGEGARCLASQARENNIRKQCQCHDVHLTGGLFKPLSPKKSSRINSALKNLEPNGSCSCFPVRVVKHSGEESNAAEQNHVSFSHWSSMTKPQHDDSSATRYKPPNMPLERKINNSLSRSFKRVIDETVLLDEKLQFAQLVQQHQFPNFSPDRIRKSSYGSISVESLIDLARKLSIKKDFKIKHTDSSSLKSGMKTAECSDHGGKSNISTSKQPSKEVSTKPTVTPTNSLEQLRNNSVFYPTEILAERVKNLDQLKIQTEKNLEEPSLRIQKSALRKKEEHKKKIKERLPVQRPLKITIAEPVFVTIKKPTLELPVLSTSMQWEINAALVPHPTNAIVVEAFSIRITRKDMNLLSNLNWINDEIINFYMNLLIERGKLETYPSVYAFNTFFYTNLLHGGHAKLKRWTKKIDIFCYDLIIIPVHLGIHWCMAAIDFRYKTIRYFDSMGISNNVCLQTLLSYLREESLDKKKVAYDTAAWKTVNLKDIPQQMNGSDCGIFTSMYSEFVCRDADLIFDQSDMPYFRRKMVYEILTEKLLEFP